VNLITGGFLEIVISMRFLVLVHSVRQELCLVCWLLTWHSHSVSLQDREKKVGGINCSYKEQKIVTNHGTVLLLMHLKPPSTSPNRMGV